MKLTVKFIIVIEKNITTRVPQKFSNFH